MVYSVNGELGDACIEAIRQMTKDIEIGDVFDGKVVKTTTFGAFVELTKGTDGLIHISNLKPGERAESVEDVVNRGDHAEGPRGRAEQGAWPDRPAARRRPGDRGQDGRGAVVDRHGHRRATAAAAGAAVTATAGVGAGRAAVIVTAAAEAATATDAGAPRLEQQHTLTRARLGHPGRDRAAALGALDRARPVGARRLARRADRRRRASRTSSSTCCSRARPS